MARFENGDEALDLRAKVGHARARALRAVAQRLALFEQAAAGALDLQGASRPCKAGLELAGVSRQPMLWVSELAGAT